jgi:hypothetical protein
MMNVPIIDQPRWPAMDAESTPAFMDFALVFKAGDEPVKYEDASQQYRFEGVKAFALEPVADSFSNGIEDQRKRFEQGFDDGLDETGLRQRGH